MPWIQKKNPRSWGSSITPTSRVWGFPEVVIAFERPQKRWPDGTDRIADMEVTAAEPPRSGPDQMQVSMLPSPSGTFQSILVNNPGGASVGRS